MTQPNETLGEQFTEYVTVTIGEQLFGSIAWRLPA